MPPQGAGRCRASVTPARLCGGGNYDGMPLALLGARSQQQLLAAARVVTLFAKLVAPTH
jgi:hypothetical protein